MKKFAIGAWGLLLAAGLATVSADTVQSEGPYLGQTPPGRTPVVFAPGIVSRDGAQRKLSVTPDGSEIIFCERPPDGSPSYFISVEKRGSGWSAPRILPFSREYRNDEPSLAPDGKTLYFVSDRPTAGGAEPAKTPDIWVSEKEGAEWSAPQNLGAPVNTPDVEVQPFLSSESILYFGRRAGNSRALFSSRFADGRFSEPAKLDERVFQGPVSGPCVSPDGRTLVVHSNAPGGQGGWDLYVSRKDESGHWGPLRNPGPPINTEKSEADASFSPDGEYLFFSRDGDIYWVSVQALGARAPLALRFVANCGVLLASGERKILIDALFVKPNEEYRAPAPEVLDQIMRGAPPFDGVDAVLVTHDHPDHFDAPLAVRYLEAFPNVRLEAPADAAEAMKKEAKDWAALQDRIAAFDLKPGERAVRDVQGISVEAFRTRHSGDRESPMNLVFRVDLNGWRILHEGDSDAKLEAFGFGEPALDLAVVHFWFPMQPQQAEWLQGLKPAHVALTHLPIRLESDAPGKIEMIGKFYRDLTLLLPGMPARVFTK